MQRLVDALGPEVGEGAHERVCPLAARQLDRLLQPLQEPLALGRARGRWLAQSGEGRLRRRDVSGGAAQPLGGGQHAELQLQRGVLLLVFEARRRGERAQRVGVRRHSSRRAGAALRVVAA